MYKVSGGQLGRSLTFRQSVAKRPFGPRSRPHSPFSLCGRGQSREHTPEQSNVKRRLHHGPTLVPIRPAAALRREPIECRRKDAARDFVKGPADVQRRPFDFLVQAATIEMDVDEAIRLVAR